MRLEPPEPDITGKCVDCGTDATLYCDRCRSALCDECDCEIAGFTCCDDCSWAYEMEHQTLADEHSCHPDSARQAVRQLLGFVVTAGHPDLREKYTYKLALLLAGVEPDDVIKELDYRVRRHERVVKRRVTA